MHNVIRDVIMETVFPQVKVEVKEKRCISANVGRVGGGRNVNFVGEK